MNEVATLLNASTLSAFWLGGVIVTLLFGEGGLRTTRSPRAFVMVLLMVALTWPLSIWFVAGKRGP